MEFHNIPPVYDKKCRILILGSFPSVRSRESRFFYAHPRNRFWLVLSSAFESDVPVSVAEKKELLLKNHIALWDVISVCDVKGSSDVSIKNALANDIPELLRQTGIKRIIANGKTAEKYYNKLVLPLTGVACETLPSTSPANASVRTEDLIKIWKNSLITS